MRKIMEWTLLIISLMAMIFLVSLERGTQRYNDMLIAGDVYDDIIADRAEANNLINRIYFDDEQLFYDRVNKIYYYSLIEGDADAYNPVVKIRSDEKNISVAFSDCITDENIEKNALIEMIAYNDDQYEKVGIHLTTLPLISIETEQSISLEDSPVKVRVFDNSENVVKRLTCSDASMRLRGYASINYPKNNFRLSLVERSIGGNKRPNKVSLLGMRKDEDWLLYGAYTDPEKIRNLFGIEIWDTVSRDNEYGIETGVEYRYTEMIMNGEYFGLVALGYPLDDKVVREYSSGKDYALYKKQGFETDSYLTYKSYENKSVIEGKTPDKGKYNLLYKYFFNEMIHRDDSDYLMSCLDIDNTIDFMLYVNFIQGYDHVRTDAFHNAYMAMREEDDGLIKCLFCPWDMDLTWGNFYCLDIVEDNSDLNFIEPYGDSPATNKIMENGYINQIIVNGDTDIIQQIVDRYHYLRQDKWSDDNLIKILDKYESEIYDSGAYRRDIVRWPEGGVNDPETGLGQFKEYVITRAHEADDYYGRLLEEKDSSIYIQRSIQYKDFLSRDVDIYIYDRSILQDKDFLDLLDYMNVDTGKITADVYLVRCNASAGRYEYVAYSEEDDRSGDNSVVIHGDNIRDFYMNLNKDYECQPILDTCANLNLYMKAMEGDSSLYFIRFDENIIDSDEDKEKFLQSYNIEDAGESTSAFFYDFKAEKGTALNDFYDSGSSAETEYGTVTFYATDEGAFGYYLNGEALYVDDYTNVEGDISCIKIRQPE